MIVSLELDNLSDVGPLANAWKAQASVLRAQADRLDAAAEQLLDAGQEAVLAMHRPAPPQQVVVVPDVTGRITTGEAPDPATGGVAMSDQQADEAIIQATGPQPGSSGPRPVVAPQPAAAPAQPAATQPAAPPAGYPNQHGVPDHVEVIPWNQ